MNFLSIRYHHLTCPASDNMRYSFDYCIFGYPNATDISSGPCITSEACGPIGNALRKGITDPDDRKQYDYCDTDDKAMLGDAVAKCQACVKADSTHTIISNCESFLCLVVCLSNL